MQWLEAEANRVALRKFIEQFRKDIKAGKRLTDKGTVYAPGTINAINQACERLKKFEKKMKREYDFDDIDMNFYRDYTAYLNEQGYSINTTGKCIKELKAIMALAQCEGLHNNSKYQDKRFKGTRVEVDSIYLTKEDLKKMMAVIFAEEFGLTAKDMNRSFIIPSRSGIHRNLSLSGDTPKYTKSLYPIWKAISEYKSML